MIAVPRHFSLRVLQISLVGGLYATHLLGHAQALPAPTADVLDKATPVASATTSGESLTARLTASCLAGATIGTFVFPGVGSAAGCVVGSGLAFIFRSTPSADAAPHKSPPEEITPP